MPKKLFISWDDFEQHTRALSLKLKSGHWKKLICITRGGLMPAALLSRYLDIKYVDTICLSSYDDATEKQGDLEIIKEIHSTDRDILVIDDLVDTGITFETVSKMLPNAHKACVYAKPNGISQVDTYALEVSQDTWIVFPWEM